MLSVMHEFIPIQGHKSMCDLFLIAVTVNFYQIHSVSCDSFTIKATHTEFHQLCAFNKNLQQ